MHRDWIPTEDQVLDELEAQRHKAKTHGMEPTEWQEAYNSPYKVKCDCEYPHVQRSGSQALGIVLDIDLCCLAQAVERLTGERYYRATYTEPVFNWNPDTLVEMHPSDRRHLNCDNCYTDDIEEEGHVGKLGTPPPWMARRLDKMTEV